MSNILVCCLGNGVVFILHIYYRSVPLIRPPILYTTSSLKWGEGLYSNMQLVSNISPPPPPPPPPPKKKVLRDCYIHFQSSCLHKNTVTKAFYTKQLIQTLIESSLASQTHFRNSLAEVGLACETRSRVLFVDITFTKLRGLPTCTSERLPVQCEVNNIHDNFAVPVLKNSNTVGHVPREISRVCFSKSHKTYKRFTDYYIYSTHLQRN